MNGEPETQLPGYWKFLWMFFMQPISLHRQIQAGGINPELSALMLLGKKKSPPLSMPFIKRMSFVLTSGPIIVVSILLLVNSTHLPIDPAVSVVGVALNVAFCVAGGVFLSVAYNVALGVAIGVAFSIAVGVVLGLSGDMAFGVTVSTAIGVAVGMAIGVGGGVVGGLAVGWPVGLAVATAVALPVGVAGGPNFALTVGMAIFLSLLRAPLWLFEAVWQIGLVLIGRFRPLTILRFSTILHHELSYFPIPLLGAHILLTAEHNPVLARRALEACEIAPGQRGIGRRTLAQLQNRELETAVRRRKFGFVAELQGNWLPGREGADPLLLGFANAARYLASAQDTTIASHSVEKLDLAARELTKVRYRLLGMQQNTAIARFLRYGALPLWEIIILDLRREATASAAGQLPNPFRAGEPLNPEEGRETFRGREDLIRSVEALLGEPGRGASIALLGPRRCGKTSLLKMLPLLIPDAVCVLFDLQDNPLDSPGSFFTALEKRAREQARRDRQINLPLLPPGSPFEAGSRWLEALDEAAGDKRILLCIDEFERLEDLFPGSRRELLQLLGLLRATVQHRRKIRLLVSGAAPFDELDELWSDHLINVRELRIGHLDEPTALGLLCKPIPEFPEDAVPDAVARTIFARTGGQPYLLQLYGSLLIEKLNQGERRQATLADLLWVEERALQQATYYFRHIPKSAPPAARATLLDLAHGRAAGPDPAVRRWLRRRLLLNEDGRLSIPVLGEWIRREEAE